ncbi:exodeoxyribonuclease VII small subunit [Enterococcus sp. LJL98]
MTKATFEESLQELDEIVQRLEKGEVPLEEALTIFQRGMELSKECENTLKKAEKTLTQMMTEEEETVLFDGESQ